jgi:hypothetical protein
VGAVALAVGLGVGLLWPRGTTGPAVFTYGPGGDIPEVPTLSTSCLQGQLAVGRQYSTTATCDDPHDVEIFDAIDLFDTRLDMAYPGRETVAAGAGPACALIFNSGRIAGADKAALRVAALAPSAEAFAYRSSPTSSFGSRSVLCALYAADGSQLSGSRIAKPTA